ncbi:cadherin-related family member 5-like [Ochotona princeps]|uniref:cadherin-related family member 5-like n=1 Tax=Ochotona princeps TaxID=9978 RepID=UPI002714D741|nr:cadherin-related family member 5-like [Ochotona princeps]
MGAWPQLWPPLVLALLLTALLGQSPGAEAQGCSVNPTIVEIEENTHRSEALAHLVIPDGQQVVLGPSTTTGAFRIEGTELFLNVTPDYEDTPWLFAELQCMRGTTLVTTLNVDVVVLDLNDNAPEFPFSSLEKSVEEDTKVDTTIIPEEELEAQDLDQNDILFYTLRELTQGASSFFSLVGENRPALKLTRTLDYDKFSSMTLELLARDTWEENEQPSHTATATLILTVLPTDLRPPWFLPCSYSDGYVCIQAQYHGAVPTGHTLSEPLVLRPGPIYAKDGDTAIGQRIIYSLLSGNQDATFTIDAASGNLTMAKSVPHPMTFLLVVKGEQEDLARYSVTQVTVEARAATGSPPYFAQTLYRGIVAPGSTAGVAVQDATAPPEPLRLHAQDDDFPDLNSAITYRVTNCSEFRMDGEALLTASSELPQDHIFYCEVEAKNTVTESTATTVVEIHVLVQNPLPTVTPGASTDTPSVGSSLAPLPSTSADLTQTRTTPGPTSEGSFRTTTETAPQEPSGYSARDMAALGGTLGGLLLLALVGLVFLSLKLYGHQLKCCARKVLEPVPRGLDNQAFQSDPYDDDNASVSSTPNAEPAPPSPPVADPDPAPPSPAPSDSAPGSPAAPVRTQGSPEAVRSILTKERRPESGYKAVWFGEDIGAEADVVVLNTPGMDGADAEADDDDDPENTYV